MQRPHKEKMCFDNTKKFWKYRKICLKHEEHKNVFYYIALYLCKLINRKSNSGIPVNRDVNEFIAPHGLSGIYISKKAIIGEDCIIFHQVTIGSNTLKDSKKFGAPRIRKKCIHRCRSKNNRKCKCWK